MAYIESPKRGQWRVRYREAGGTLKSSKRFTDKSDALQCLAICEAKEEARGHLGIGEAMSFLGAIEAYCKDRQTHKRAKPEHLDRNIRAPLRRLAEARTWVRLDDVKVGRVGPLNIGEHRALKAVLRCAATLGQPVDQGLLLMRGPKRLRKPQRDLLRPDQVAALVDDAAEWCHASGALAHVLSTYGHRPQTAVQTLVRHVDLERGLISLEVKGGDKLRHPLLPTTIAWLRPLVEGRAPDDFLFIGHDGKPWQTGQRLSQWWFHYVGGRVTAPRGENGEPNGPPTHPGIYALKQYAISSMLERGLAPKTICSITGHRTPATLHLYARTNEDRQREAMLALASLPTSAPRLAGP